MREAAKIALNTAGATAGVGIAALVPGPAGILLAGAVTSTVADLADRALSVRQSDRVKEVVAYSVERMKEKGASGAALRQDLDESELTEIVEGTLLAAKDTYEARKLPLIGNLLAAAPFTNTPIANLIGTLSTADSLTYRKLCLISAIGTSSVFGRNGYQLSERSLGQLHPGLPAELVSGILSDLQDLLTDALVVEVSEDGNAQVFMGLGAIRPARLALGYPARLLFNGMLLNTVPEADLNPILQVLRGPTPASEKST